MNGPDLSVYERQDIQSEVRSRLVMAEVGLLGLSMAVGLVVEGVSAADRNNSPDSAFKPENAVETESKSPTTPPGVVINGGKMVVHFAQIPGSSPRTDEFVDSAIKNAEEGWQILETASNGKISMGKVEEGKTLNLGDEVGHALDACDESKYSELTQNLASAVRSQAPPESPKDISVVVVDMDSPEGTCAASESAPAAFPDSRIVIVYGTAHAGTYAHEANHVITNYGHDNGVYCKDKAKNEVAVTKECTPAGYNNFSTNMGSGREAGSDRDYMTAFERRRLGLISEQQVETLERDGSHNLTLSALMDGDGTKIIRIPYANTDIDTLQEFKTNSLYLELSGDLEGGSTQGLSLKAYLANERAVTDRNEPSDTYLLNLSGEVFEHGLTPKDIGQTVKIAIGNKVIELRLDTLTINGPASGNTIFVANISTN